MDCNLRWNCSACWIFFLRFIHWIGLWFFFFIFGKCSAFAELVMCVRARVSPLQCLRIWQTCALDIRGRTNEINCKCDGRIQQNAKLILSNTDFDLTVNLQTCKRCRVKHWRGKTISCAAAAAAVVAESAVPVLSHIRLRCFVCRDW